MSTHTQTHTDPLFWGDWFAHWTIMCACVAFRNQSEAENMTWILVNTKNCPKCKNPIEKNHGCMHMVCAVHTHTHSQTAKGPNGQPPSLS